MKKEENWSTKYGHWIPLIGILIFVITLLFYVSQVEATTWLKQSTAVTVKLGPFVDATDATKEESLTITQAEVRLSKNGGDMAQKGNADALGHDELGVYDCNLSTTDTGTLGQLDIYVYESGAMLEWRHFMVVDPNLYDTFFSTGEVDIYSVRGVVPMTQANIETYSETGADASISSAALATATELAETDANVALILADSNELQEDWANGGRLDLILDETLVDANQAAQGGAGITAEQVWEDANATTASVAVLIAEAAEADANMIIVLAELAEADANNAAILGDTSVMDPIVQDLAGISEIGDKVVADMDANSILLDWADGERLDLILDETLVDANTAAQASGASAAAVADAVLEELIADHEDVAGSLAAIIREIRNILGIGR